MGELIPDRHNPPVYPKACAKCERYCAMWRHHNALDKQIEEADEYLRNVRLETNYHDLAKGLYGTDLYSEEAIVDSAYRVSEVPYSGVYFLIRDKRVVYVGQSKNALSRIQTHITGSAIDFTHCSVIWTRPEHLDVVESLYILILNPIHNVRPPLSWRQMQSRFEDVSAEKEDAV